MKHILFFVAIFFIYNIHSIKAQNKTSDYYLNSAADKMRNSDYDGAYELCSKAITAGDKSGLAYFLRGCINKMKNRCSNACDDFSNAIRQKPDYAEAYFGRGTAKVELGQFQSALSDYNTAIRYNPSLGQVFYHRAIVKLGLNDDSGACSDYKKSLQLGFQSPNGYGVLPQLCK